MKTVIFAAVLRFLVVSAATIAVLRAYEWVVFGRDASSDADFGGPASALAVAAFITLVWSHLDARMAGRTLARGRWFGTSTLVLAALLTRQVFVAGVDTGAVAACVVLTVIVVVLPASIGTATAAGTTNVRTQ